MIRRLRASPLPLEEHVLVDVADDEGPAVGRGPGVAASWVSRPDELPDPAGVAVAVIGDKKALGIRRRRRRHRPIVAGRLPGPPISSGDVGEARQRTALTPCRSDRSLPRRRFPKVMHRDPLLWLPPAMTEAGEVAQQHLVSRVLIKRWSSDGRVLAVDLDHPHAQPKLKAPAAIGYKIDFIKAASKQWENRWRATENLAPEVSPPSTTDRSSTSRR